jgi:hypothetical protein
MHTDPILLNKRNPLHSSQVNETVMCAAAKSLNLFRVPVDVSDFSCLITQLYKTWTATTNYCN